MEELNNPAKRSEIEYATQHFGFPPDSFVDTLIGDAKTCVEEYLSVSTDLGCVRFPGFSSVSSFFRQSVKKKLLADFSGKGVNVDALLRSV